jgi:regulator of protease activity HflC (stomatin/prohibitin superfamily)
MFDKLIEFLINSIKLFQFFAVVRVNEAGVVLRLGNFNRVAKRGFNWLLPFSIEELFFERVTLETIASDPQSVTTKDDISCVVSMVVTFKIEDAKTFILDVQHGRIVLDNLICGCVARKTMDHTWSELVVMDLSDELAKIIRRKAKKLGIAIEEAQVVDLTRSQSFRLIGHHMISGM